MKIVLSNYLIMICRFFSEKHVIVYADFFEKSRHFVCRKFSKNLVGKENFKKYSAYLI
jgi:hypothetical protein